MQPSRLSISERALARVGKVVQQKYVITRLVGVGGMAAVYAAKHRNGNRVAIKYLLDHFAGDNDVLNLFRREAYVANHVDHPGAVPVLDDDVDDEGAAFLIMPLLEGETLRARWERAGRRLSVGEVAVITADVLDVLAAAHAKGIVHRDIKPDNLFVTTTGSVRVLDFGIARRNDIDGGGTVTGRIIGTPGFMAPEQALADRNALGPHSDCWSVGATMFALLAGEFVHQYDSAPAQLAAAATKKARSLRELLPNLPDPIVQFVDKSLAFDPADRWRSAAEMRAAMSDAFAESLGQPVDALATRIRKELSAELVSHALETQREALEPSGRPDAKDAAASNPTAKATAAAPDAQPPRGDGGPTVMAAGVVPKPTRPGRGTRSMTAAGIAALALGVGVFLAAAANRSATKQDAPPTPTAEKAEDEVTSSDPRAIAEFKAGLQSMRDASKWTAGKHFARAIELDPTLAPAHLYSIWIPPVPNDFARAHYRAASEHRSSLGARDRALLEAYGPAMAVPPDLQDSERRLAEVRRAFPSDWRVLRALAYTQILRSNFTDAIAVLDDLIGQDPSLAMAWADKGHALSLQDDIPGTRDAFAECLQISRYGEKCLDMMWELEANEGHCSEGEGYARTLMSVSSPIPLFALELADMIQARGGAVESVRQALEHARKLAPEAQRDALQFQYETHLDVLNGSFAAAERDLDRWDKAIADDRYEEDHGRLAKMRFYLAMELGDRDKAARLAREYLAKRDAWLASPYFDFEVWALRVQYLAGGLSREAYRKRREAWLARDEAAHPQYCALPSLRWTLSYALAVADREDAQEALGALPRYGITDHRTRAVDSDDGLGFVYLLTDDIQRALPYLRRGAASCTALDYPFEHTWVNSHLGTALERVGDVPGACAAYDRVLARWGREARSVTAKLARQRRAALACPTAAR
ncbi:protein kinase [Pendulispora rubella]|uniref:Protein kinase n=1 Tax=Pendulispora rubella TaxID=2741070 RepID=A0ABZ2LE10_9BACT